MRSDRDDWDDQEREALAPIERELTAARARHRADPPLELLRAAHAEALPDALLKATGAHLESNAWSRALVDGADTAAPELDAAATDRLLVRVKNSATRETEARRRTWTPIFAFAAVAALVVAFVVWRTAARHAPSVTAVDRSGPPIAAPSPSRAREFRLELTKPAVKLTAAALVLRGDRNSGFVDDVADGLNAYRAGDYEKAVRELDALQPRYPKSVEIPFYAAISHLMLNDAPSATRALETARDLNDDTFRDDVAWYLAVAYERAGEVERSRSLLDTLCSGSGRYATRACAAAGTFR